MTRRTTRPATGPCSLAGSPARLFLAGLLLAGGAAWAPPAAAGPSGPAHALAEAGAESGEEAEMDALLAILEEETEVATKTSMNGDFVPGIVTVLHGDDLQALGVQTVHEALSLVPGVHLLLADSASPSLVVRGMPFPFNSGNVKILMNGVAMSRESAGVNTSMLLVPIEQVERIEVLRGSGSAVHGDFAATGLVNVVTRRERSEVHAELRSGETIAAGASIALPPKGGWRLAANVAGLASDDAEARAPFAAEEERLSAFVSLEKGATAVLAQLVHRDREESLPAGAAPVPPGPRPAEDLSLSLHGRHRIPLPRSLRLDVRGSFVRNDLEVFPTDFAGNALEVGADAVWTGGKHELLAGVAWGHSNTDEAVHRRPPGFPEPLLVLRDVDRETVSLTLQEQFRPTEALTLTAGLRLDDFDDLDAHVSPRLAAVWRAAPRHVLKGQYSESFRAPTFFELYDRGVPQPGLDVSTFTTLEANYVYRRPSAVGRATVFHAELDDDIRPGPLGFANFDGKTVRGVELEWSQQVHERVKLGGNVTYLDTSEGDPSGEADWLGNVTALARPAADLVVAGRWSHLGTRRIGDAEFGGHDMVDLSAGWERFLAERATVRAGVKNVFDDVVDYPLFRPAGPPSVLVFGGRTAWVNVSYAF